MELEQLERQRKQRLLTVLTDIDKRLAQQVLRPSAVSPAHIRLADPRGSAALRLQCWWRSVRSLREFRHRTLEHYLEEDRRYWAKQDQVVEETFVLLQTLQLQQDRQHRRWIEEAHRRLCQRSAYAIQKWFRRNSSGEERRNRESNKAPHATGRRNDSAPAQPIPPPRPPAINMRPHPPSIETEMAALLKAQRSPLHRRPVSPCRALKIDVGDNTVGGPKGPESLPLSPSQWPPETLYDLSRTPTPKGPEEACHFRRVGSKDFGSDPEAEGDSDSIFDVNLDDEGEEGQCEGELHRALSSE